MSEVEKSFESALEAITSGLSKLKSANLDIQGKDAQIGALTQRVEDQNKEIEKLQARIKFLESKNNIFGNLVAKLNSTNNDQALFILKEKKCQTIPPGTLNVFYILVIHTDNAQVSFVLIALCQPGGAAINFSKSPRNQNWTTLLL